MRITWDAEDTFVVTYVYRLSFDDETLDTVILAKASADRYGAKIDNYTTIRNKRTRKADD